jgi:hypothetical protein
MTTASAHHRRLILGTADGTARNAARFGPAATASGHRRLSHAAVGRFLRAVLDGGFGAL